MSTYKNLTQEETAILLIGCDYVITYSKNIENVIKAMDLLKTIKNSEL